MSYYYGNPFLGFPQQYHRRPVATHPAHVQPQFNFFSAPPPAHPHPHPHSHPYSHSHLGAHGPARRSHDFDFDYEAEERAALAHLRSIQRRREEAEAAAAREAVIRARAEAQRQAAIQYAIDRDQAIARAVELERERELIAREQVRERERQRQAAALARHAALVAARQREAAQRARDEAHRAARAQRCADRCAKRVTKDATAVDDWRPFSDFIEALLGVNIVDDGNDKQKDTAIEHSPAVKADQSAEGTALKSVIKVAEAVEQPTNKDEKENIANKQVKEDTATPAFPEDINALLNHFLGLRVEPVSDKNADPATSGIPAGLNEFLSQFGLVFEPTESADAKAADTTSTKISEPVSAASAAATQTTKPTPASKPASSHKPAPRRCAKPTQPSVAQPAEASTSSANEAQTPLSSFLNGVADLPPFVRDILSNVELAFSEDAGRTKDDHKSKDAATSSTSSASPTAAPTEATSTLQAPASAQPDADADAEVEAQGKGKSVAEGEKPALDKLNSIADELDLATASFTFPAHLSFGPAPGAAEPVASLLFNRNNRPYHAQSNKLLQLLLQADGVASGGDREVRRKRKDVVKAVEAALNDLEKRRDAAWADVKERRERGESDDEDEATSSGASTNGDINEKDIQSAPASPAHETVPAPAHETAPAPVAEDSPTPVAAGHKAIVEDAKETDAEGFDVHAHEEVESKSVDVSQTPATSVPASAPVTPESASTANGADVEVEHVENAEQETEVEKKEEKIEAAEAKKADQKEDGYELL